MILFACEVAAGIWGFVNKDQVILVGGSYALSPPTVVGCSEPIVIGCFLNFWGLLVGAGSWELSGRGGIRLSPSGEAEYSW